MNSDPTQTECNVTLWRRLYYPVEASDAAKEGALAAVDHCIKKWEGFLPSVLTAFGFYHADNSAVILNRDDTEVIGAYRNTCALCVRYDDDCRRCPVTLAGSLPCSDPHQQSAWWHWYKTGDPGPMLDTLRRARSWVLLYPWTPPSVLHLSVNPNERLISLWDTDEVRTRGMEPVETPVELTLTPEQCAQLARAMNPT